jgi:putative acetyltransferase
MPLVLELVETPTDDARRLIDELEAELGGHFPPEQRHGYSVDRVFQPHVRFFIARLDGKAVGCGGVAFEHRLAEVKRMYVRPAWRGRGVGRTILARLEAEAAAGGVERVVLETGDVLLPAIAMYERAGFARCAAFGAYRSLPPGSIARSVFLEKRLAPPLP